MLTRLVTRPEYTAESWTTKVSKKLTNKHCDGTWFQNSDDECGVMICIALPLIVLVEVGRWGVEQCDEALWFKYSGSEA